MECNGHNYVCHTQAGSFLPMKERDITFIEYIFVNEYKLSLETENENSKKLIKKSN